MSNDDRSKTLNTALAELLEDGESTSELDALAEVDMVETDLSTRELDALVEVEVDDEPTHRASIPTVPPPIPERAGKTPPPALPQRTPVPTPRPSAAPDPQFMDDAGALVQFCMAELLRNPPAARAARMHLDVAQTYEDVLDDMALAATHYEKALEHNPDSLPCIRGARRLYLATGDHEKALPLFEAEARLSPDPRAKALLHYERAQVLDNVLDRADDAREAYLIARALDPGNLAILKAIERLAVKKNDFSELSRTYERAANATTGDARLRAAYLVKRAKLAEDRFNDAAAAVEFAETALSLDPGALGALEMLERLYHKRRDWPLLISVLERKAKTTRDARMRAIALQQIGRLHADRLGNRAEALDALTRAARATDHRDRAILDDLARLHEQNQDFAAVIEVLGARLAITSAPTESVELHHRVGQIAETHLGDDERAMHSYAAALQIDATHEPTLHALDALYSRRNEWARLVAMYQAEAEATAAEDRRAAVHTRIADIVESRLGQIEDAIEHHGRALSLDPGAVASFKALTRLLPRTGRYRELADLYEQALDTTRDPVRKLAWLFKIGALWEDTLDDSRQAAHAYRRVLDIDKKNLGAIHALQRVSERAGRHQELVEALDREAELCRDTELVVALLHRAGEVLDQALGDAKQAVDRFLRVLKLKPAHGPTLKSMARLYHRAGRWHDLLDVYKRELAITTDQREAAILLHKMGELADSQLGRPQDAIEFYRRAADRDPEFRPAIRVLGQALRERGDWAGLVDVLDIELKGVKNPHGRAQLLCTAGHIHEDRLQQVDKALSCYEHAAAVAPDYWPARLALGRLRGDNGAWKPLLAELARDGKSAVDAIDAGTALLRQGEIWRDRLSDSERAIECFETLRESEPGALPALLSLESLYEQSGAWQLLAQVFATEVKQVSDPGAQVAALRELARLQESKGVGTAADAVATYEAILGLMPTDTAALDALQRLARDHRDGKRFVKVARQLATVTGDAELRARYLTSLGLWLERAGDRNAIRAYQAALDSDTHNLPAIRGLMRMATALGDHAGQAQAARHEAELLDDPRARANMLVHSGVIRLEQLGDSAGAIDDLARALEIWPDDERAARALCQPLIAGGQAERLVTLLSQAAGSARTPRRAAGHWLAVAEVYMEHLDNLASAYTALRRALRAVPDHLPAIDKLARAYVADRRWQSAIETYQRLVEAAREPAAQSAARMAMATIWRDQLDNAGRAEDCLSALLQQDPTHREALASLAKLRVAGGDAKAAVDIAQTMIATSHDLGDRASALVFLAEIHVSQGDLDRAESALIEALALQGPGETAAEMFRKLIRTQGTWVGYATGLTAYIRQATERGDKLVQAYLELARVHGDKMDQPDKAVANLEAGLEATGGAAPLAAELCRYLRKSGRLDEAVIQLRRLLANDVTQTELWRGLAQTLGQMQRPEEATLAIAPLMVMEAATMDERRVYARRVRRTAEAMDGSFTPDILASLAPDQALSGPAAQLLAAAAEGAAKLYRAELEELGISRRDRISSRARHPLRMAADRLAAILGMEFELYLHPRTEPAASLVMTEPISIVIAEHVGNLSEPQQVFWLASAMVPVAGRYYPADKLSARELAEVLAAAARIAYPGHGAEFEDIESHTQRLKKAMPRKWRRAVETAAADYVAAGPVDTAAWQESLRRTTLRAAMLLADDLLETINALRDSEDIEGDRGVELVRDSALATDLIGFWGSRQAVDIRRATGLLMGAPGMAPVE